MLISFNLSAQLLDKKPKLSLGDRLNVFSEKAFRKESGSIFEAIGNVVIKSGRDTIYGQRASYKFDTGDGVVEGNVRFIGEGFALYGSKIEFNSTTNDLMVYHARFQTDDLSIYATKIKKLTDNKFMVWEGEFSTCQDCPESWSIFGQEIIVETGQYITIKQGVVKTKGIDLLAIPYLILPIKNQRESGLLFPMLFSRANEGLTFKQPYFLNLGRDKDLTLTPGFLGDRGQGLDWQYRQAFNDRSYLEINQFLVNDEIYEVGKRDISQNEETYFRNFSELEFHAQPTHEWTSHFKFNGVKDLDFVTDFPLNVDERIYSEQLGMEAFSEYRFDELTASVEMGMLRNMITRDVEQADPHFVNLLPKLSLGVKPYSYYVDNFLLSSIQFSLNTELSHFTQEEQEESLFIRNARRANILPEVKFNWGSSDNFNLYTNLTQQSQFYQLPTANDTFEKHATLSTTEFNLEFEKIFGVAYQRRVPVRFLTEESAIALSQDVKKNQVMEQGNFIGELPDIDSFIQDETITMRSNAYKHHQQYKVIHYKILSAHESGNEQFEQQISNQRGWFDYQDAVMSKLTNAGSNATQTLIPLEGAFEFQWNNSLVKKSPKGRETDDSSRYLKDYFNYQRLGFFNVSQGVLTEVESEDFTDKLTRLSLHTGYNFGDWNFSLRDFYFHQNASHIVNTSVLYRKDPISTLFSYTENTFVAEALRTSTVGLMLKPTDSFGISYLQQYDLALNENIRTIYQVDFMPDNNCWLINLNFKDSVNEKRYAFNFMINFGDEEFANYRGSFFNFARLNNL